MLVKNAIPVLALPNFEVYQRMINELRPKLEKLGIVCIMVDTELKQPPIVHGHLP